MGLLGVSRPFDYVQDRITITMVLDGCHEAGIRFYLGNALSMRTITGHKKKDDLLDAETIANQRLKNFYHSNGRPK